MTMQLFIEKIGQKQQEFWLGLIQVPLVPVKGENVSPPAPLPKINMWKP